MWFVQRSAIVVILTGSLPLATLAERLPIGQPTAFWIDSTEVTIGQFEQFARQNDLTTAAERDGGGYEYRLGWQQREGWNFRQPFGKPGASNEPAVHVSWFEADQYCQSKGGRLPTREQWSEAAYQETGQIRPLLFRQDELMSTQPGIQARMPTLWEIRTAGRFMHRWPALQLVSMACMTWAPTYGNGWPMTGVTIG